ncbi:MAG: phospholipase D-like domain-containing protein [Candidatus Sericytochromatia bacterium]
MTSKKILTAFSSIILLFSSFSCSETNISDVKNNDIYNANSNLSYDFSNSAIGVKFNNAYKGLYEENEKIARNDPNNPDKIFVRMVNEAKRSIDVAIFDMEEPNSCQSLIDAHNRGVKVRIVTDSDNLNEKKKNSQPRKVIEDMKAAGIPIVDDRRNAFMHHKFAIIDEEIVITGSLNLSINSMYRDNNNAIRIRSKQLAQSYKAEFERMFTEKMFGPNDHKIPYKQVNIEGAKLTVYFSPKGGTMEAILKELSKARKSIKFMTFSLTDKNIYETILSKSKSGVKVEGIFDGCMLSKYSLYQSFIENKIPVYIDGNQAILHNKVFIIDDHIIITGSYNFSKNAEQNNNENTLIIDSYRLAQYYNDEYGKLKNSSLTNKNLPPYENRKCSSTENGNDDSVIIAKD